MGEKVNYKVIKNLINNSAKSLINSKELQHFFKIVPFFPENFLLTYTCVDLVKSVKLFEVSVIHVHLYFRLPNRYDTFPFWKIFLLLSLVLLIKHKNLEGTVPQSLPPVNSLLWTNWLMFGRTIRSQSRHLWNPAQILKLN